MMERNIETGGFYEQCLMRRNFCERETALKVAHKLLPRVPPIAAPAASTMKNPAANGGWENACWIMLARVTAASIRAIYTVEGSWIFITITVYTAVAIFCIFLRLCFAQIFSLRYLRMRILRFGDLIFLGMYAF